MSITEFAARQLTQRISCSTGVYDCQFNDPDDDAFCAPYNGTFKNIEGDWGAVILAGIVMCLMAFGIGANDVANAWGTSVGSGAVGIKTAAIIAGLADLSGAVTLGYGVSTKIQKGVSDVTDEDCWACGYCNSKMSVYYVGMFGALMAAAIFLMLATYTRMPVSTTHAIVGAVAGITIAAVGGACVDWSWGGLGGIIASWFISPLMSGVVGGSTYLITDNLLLKSSNPRESTLRAMPVLFSFVSFVMVFLIMIKSEQTQDLGMEIQASTAGAAFVLALLVSRFKVVPFIRSRLPSNNPEADFKINETDKSGDVSGPEDDADTVQRNSFVDATANRESYADALQLETKRQSPELADAMFAFKYLLVFNAVLESFAHGANDTANSTAAFSAVLSGFKDGLHACNQKATPWYVMFTAGSFVLLGIYTLGYRVIGTIGKDLSIINFHRGFCMEFASTVTVVFATIMEWPVSTTHAQIGAVVFVSLAAFGRKKVSFGLLGQVVLSWFITLPFAGLLATAFMESFKAMIRV